MFVVQENHGPHKYTRIHKVGCSFARLNGHTTRNTRWYPLKPDGRLDRFRHAHALAVLLGQRDGPFKCKHCFREITFTKAEVDKHREIALEMLE